MQGAEEDAGRDASKRKRPVQDDPVYKKLVEDNNACSPYIASASGTDLAYLSKARKFIHWMNLVGWVDADKNRSHEYPTLTDAGGWNRAIEQWLRYVYVRDVGGEGKKKKGLGDKNLNQSFSAVARLWQIEFYKMPAEWRQVNNEQAVAPSLKTESCRRVVNQVFQEVKNRRTSKRQYDIQKHKPDKSYQGRLAEVLDEFRLRAREPGRQRKSMNNLPFPWHKNPKRCVGLREAFDFCWSNGSADRSEVKRNANLGHLSGEKTWVYRQGGACNCKGGAHTCDRNELFTVCVFLDKRKTWSYDPGAAGKKFQASFFSRHKDVVVCPVAALACYFVFRFHQHGEALPDFLNPHILEATPVLIGRFVAANELAGKEKASMDDVNGKGLWDDSVMRKHYLILLNWRTETMCSGFETPNHYRLHRRAREDELRPPGSCVRMLFSGKYFLKTLWGSWTISEQITLLKEHMPDVAEGINAVSDNISGYRQEVNSRADRMERNLGAKLDTLQGMCNKHSKHRISLDYILLSLRCGGSNLQHMPRLPQHVRCQSLCS
eukprot:jgi/Tetstr1/458055/TSEL_044562.t2